jgi:hypothetical protein
LRKLALLISACTVVGLASFALAQQQVNIAVGDGILESSKTSSASVGFLPPTEKGGTYPGASAEVIFSNHVGVNAEGYFRYHPELYDGFQKFRPMLFDVNAEYAARVTNRIRADGMAGIGVQDVLFYNQYVACNPAYLGGCSIHANNNHFMEHIGGDIRYYFWRNFFVRPEVHYYHIQNNTQIFSSNNVVRLGASIGFSLVRKR